MIDGDRTLFGTTKQTWWYAKYTVDYFHLNELLIC